MPLPTVSGIEKQGGFVSGSMILLFSKTFALNDTGEITQRPDYVINLLKAARQQFWR